MKILPAALLACSCTLLLSGCDAILAAYKATATPAHADAASVPTAPVAPSDPGFAPAAEQVRQLARELVVEQNLPGLSIAVAMDGELVWAEGLGWANIEKREPITPATRFRIGTTSKALTAAAAGVLVQRGVLDLDAPVQQYLPGFPEKGAPISTRQAMAHTAGFTHFPLDDHFEPLAQCDTMAEALDQFDGRKLRFTPGDSWAYSSLGWVLVSAVVESAADQPFATLVEKEVLVPLGMQATVPDKFRDPHPQQAGIYWPRAAMDTSYGLEHPGIGNSSCFPGAVDYLSTPSDLVRFGVAMNRNALLEQDTTTLLQTPVTLSSGRSTGHGLGWSVETVQLAGNQTLRIGHPGEAVGGTTAFHRYPELDMVVAVSSNVTFVDLEPFASQVARLFVAQRQAPLAAGR